MLYEINYIGGTMVEGKYNIKMKTPKGYEQGTLVILQQGTSIMGYLAYNGANYKFTGGKAQEYDFEFDGEFKWMFMRVPYKAKGQVLGDKLRGIVYTKFGDFPVEGNKL